MMHTDWKKELNGDASSVMTQDSRPCFSHIFPPRSLICAVTTASPIHTSANTPEKTTIFCSDEAVIERSRLSDRQKIRGPLDTYQHCDSYRTQDFRCIPTKDPSHVDPRSFPPAGRHLHPAIGLRRPRDHQRGYDLRLALHLPIRLLAARNLQAGIWATRLDASSPTLPVHPATMYPILIRQWCSVELDDLRLVSTN